MAYRLDFSDFDRPGGYYLQVRNVKSPCFRIAEDVCTTPDMPNYLSSRDIVRRLFQFEQDDPNGLNGAILLIHPGTSPELDQRLPQILERFTSLNYRFKRL